MTADSSTSTANNHSPRSPLTFTADGGGRRSFPSPWAQVVRGGDTETTPSPSSRSPEQAPFSDLPVQESAPATETQVDSPESSNGSNAGRSKKPAWNKPSNGVVVEAASSVMGAVSWPALSESTRPVPKSSSESSSKPISDGSVSHSQVPVISQTPQKQANKTHENSNSTTNHTHHVPQRSMKRGGGGGPAVFNRPQPPQAVPPLRPPYPVFDMSYGNMVPAVLDSPIREPPYKGNNWAARSMAGVGHDPSLHRNPSRMGNFGGGRPRGGDGPLYVNGFGGRRDLHDRAPRSPGYQMAPPPPPTPRGYLRQPHPGPAPFIAPQPMRPFANPMGYDMTSAFLYLPTLPPEPFGGALLLPHAAVPAMFFSVMDPPLPVLILNQIEYYFSDANLVKDNFLRSNMDDEGWVPIALIAGFPRVQTLTNDIQLILNSLRDSTAVELQGDKVRRRNEWWKWVPTSDRSSTELELQSPSGSSHTLLEETSFQMLTLDVMTTTNQINEDSISSVDQSQLANGEASTEASPSNI